MEEKRLKLLKEVMFNIKKCIKIQKDKVINKIYEELYNKVKNEENEKDLKWW